MIFVSRRDSEDRIAWRSDSVQPCWLIPVFVTLMLSIGFHVWAETEETQRSARELFDRATALVETGDLESAIELFQQSHSLFPHPGTLLNIALYQEEAGHLDDAFRSYSELLSLFGDIVSESTRSHADDRTADLEEELARLSITTFPEQTSVEIDGRPFGTTPFARPLRVLPGPHRIELRRDGYETIALDRVLHVGDNPGLEVELSPLIDEPFTANLTIHSTPSDAQVFVNGEPAASTPPPLELAPGAHDIRLSAPGHQGQSLRVELVAGEEETIELSLLPMPSETSLEEDRGRRFWRSPWTWIVGSLLIAGVSVGASSAVVASNRNDDNPPDVHYHLR